MQQKAVVLSGSCKTEYRGLGGQSCTLVTTIALPFTGPSFQCYGSILNGRQSSTKQHRDTRKTGATVQVMRATGQAGGMLSLSRTSKSIDSKAQH